MIVQELITKLGFSVDNGKLKSALAQINSLKTASIALVGAFVGVGSALTAVTISAAHYGDEVAKAGKRLGITAEDVQSLSYAARLSGTSFEEAGIGLKFLQRNAYEASKGNGAAAKNFKDLGIKVKGANGQIKPLNDLLGEVADKVAAVQDPARKTALAMRLLGRGGAQMIPLLDNGAAGLAAMRQEAEDLGGVLSNDTAKSAEDLTDSLHRLTFTFSGFMHRLGAGLFPILQRVVDGIVNFSKRTQGLQNAFISLTALLSERTLHIFESLGTAAMFLGKAFGVVAEGVFASDNKLWQWIKVAGVALALLAAIGGAALIANLGWIALAFGIAAVIDDIVTYAQNGDSALKRLFDYFLIDPESEDNWMLKVLREIKTEIDDIIKGWAAFNAIRKTEQGKKDLNDKLYSPTEWAKYLNDVVPNPAEMASKGFLRVLTASARGYANQAAGRRSANPWLNGTVNSDSEMFGDKSAGMSLIPKLNNFGTLPSSVYGAGSTDLRARGPMSVQMGDTHVTINGANQTLDQLEEALRSSGVTDKMLRVRDTVRELQELENH